MIDQLIKRIAKDHDVRAVYCKVNTVNLNDNTCEVSPINGDADFLEVRLRASITEDIGMITVPSVGSDVLVAYSEGQGQAYVAMTSKIDKVIWKIGNKTITIDDKGLKVEGGADFTQEILNLYGIVGDLLTELQSFKVLTPVGPSTGVFPTNVLKLKEFKSKLDSSEEKIKQVIN